MQRNYLQMQFFAILLTASTLLAAEPRQGGYPSAIAEFKSTDVQLHSHPAIFYTPDDAQDARSRLKNPKYATALAALDDHAKKARDLDFESIDPQWWQAEKDKPWSDTYPIIYEKTCLVPVRMALPAHYTAMRYLLSGDQTDLDAARRILLHLGSYTFEFKHYDVGMNYAVWGCHALGAYDILYDTLTVDQRKQMDAFFTRMARAILKNDIYWIENNIGGGINNHLAWHKMMLGMLGLFYDRAELVEFALNGPRGILPLLDDGLVDDGLWCESSLTYHFTAIVPMTYLAKAMRNTDHPKDLFTITTPAGRTLRQPYDAMFDAIFPDRSIPPIGDSYGRKKFLHDEFTYAHAARAYRDPRHEWLLANAELKRPETLFIGAETDNAAAPKIASRLYTEHGYAFLRTAADNDYWNTDAACAFLTFDKSGVHANQDKLSLMLFANKKLLLRDVEALATVPHAFSAKVQRQLNRSALSQNTVMIDHHDQRSIGELLTLVEYKDDPDCKTITAADTKGLLYPGVKQSRTIILTEDYCLDVFQVVADKPHDIHWITHTIGDPASQNTSLDLQPTKNNLPAPAQWLQNFKQAQTDAPFTFQWTEDNVTLKMTTAAAENTKIISCGYPTTDEPNCPTIPMLLIHRRAAQTIFVTLYQSTKTTIAPMSPTIRGSTTMHHIIQITTPRKNHHHSIPRLN